MFEVTFKMQHDCPYTRFSMKHPSVRLAEWCNNHIHVVEVDCPDIETYTTIEPDLNGLLLWNGGKILKKNFLAGNLQLIVKTCRCSRLRTNVAEVIGRNACLVIDPQTYFGGWEEYRVLGFREGDYKKIFEELGKLGPVEILSKKLRPERSIRNNFVISVSSVFSDLTDKQVNSLLTALEFGYYQIPKKMTTEEISRKQRVPRTTFEEHLRKAESKVLLAMAPYVRMFASKPDRAIESVPQITAR